MIVCIHTIMLSDMSASNEMLGRPRRLWLGGWTALACAVLGMWAVAGASGATLADQQKLTAPMTGPAREVSPGGFGGSAALSANGATALVGASAVVGGAWIYARTPEGWKLVQELRPPGQRSDVSFGSDVALSANGNTAVISGPLKAGAVWVFVRAGTSWRFRQRLSAPSVGRQGERGAAGFGDAVAVSSNASTLLVGGPTDDRGAGAAWVFTHAKRGWELQRKLTVATRGTNARDGPAHVGSSVALSSSGNTALLGGPSDQPLSGNDGAVGAAWLFTRAGQNWTDEQKLSAPVNGPDEEINTDISGGEFGSSVAMSASGRLALIGGANDNDLAGAVWAYTLRSASWSEQQKLTAPSSGADGELGNAAGFGSSLALAPGGTAALVGGPDDGFGTGDNLPFGAAWSFTIVGGSWSEQQKLVAPASGPDRELNPGGGTAAQFGSSVALSQNASTAVIGGPADDDPYLGEPYPDEGGRGAAWIFGPSPGPADVGPFGA
jgi:hypothetical protein